MWRQGDGVGTLADGADDGAFRDDAPAHYGRRAELQQRDRMRVGLDRDRPTAARYRADE